VVSGSGAHGPPAPLDLEHVDAVPGAERGLGQGLPDQRRARLHLRALQGVVELEALPQLGLARGVVLVGGGGRGQEDPARRRQQHHGDGEDQQPDGGDGEEPEAGARRLRQGVRRHEVRRRPDEGQQAAELRREGHGQQQPRRRQGRAPRQRQHDGDHHRHRARRAHQGAEEGGQEHRRHDGEGLAPPHAAGRSPGQAGRGARRPQPLADDEERRQDHHHGAREAREGLLDGQGAAQREDEEGGQGHEIDADPVGHEEDDGDQEGSEDEDLHRPTRSLLEAVAHPPEVLRRLPLGP
jgi:hypothetical protein